VGVLALVLSAIVGGVSGGLVAFLTSGETAAPPATITAPDGATSPPIGTILTRIEESVVRIDVAGQAAVGPFGEMVGVQSTGTGFVIAAEGMIATAAHVVSGAERIIVTLDDGSTAAATVVGADTDADLAVIHIDRSDLVPLTLGRSADLLPGEQVLAIGHALALEGAPTVSLGILSAVDRSIALGGGETYEHLLQTDAAINAGDSGGPLVDMAGQVIGINTAKVSTEVAENMGFAIAIDEALPVLEALQAGA
jgi:S1-C subfamily serine protease